MCFLKEECFKLRRDRRSLDISGVVLRDLRDGASGDPEQDDAKMEANAAAEQAELEAHVKHWEEETASIKDSPLGGAFIQVRLVKPEVVRCMQFVVPPRLKAQFPQAARIQFSSDNGTSWRTSQGLEPIGQQSLLVKTVSMYADAAFLETRGGLHPAPPPPPGPIAPSADLVDPQTSLSEAVAAAMKAAKEASAAKGAAGPFALAAVLVDATLSDHQMLPEDAATNALPRGLLCRGELQEPRDRIRLHGRDDARRQRPLLLLRVALQEAPEEQAAGLAGPRQRSGGGRGRLLHHRAHGRCPPEQQRAGCGGGGLDRRRRVHPLSQEAPALQPLQPRSVVSR